jgi:hypothetical protein
MLKEEWRESKERKEEVREREGKRLNERVTGRQKEKERK